MKRAFVKAGYAVLITLLVLIFYIVYDGTQNQPNESLSVFSAKGVSLISILCLFIGAIAGSMAVFYIIRAFYLAFTRPQTKAEHKPKV
ncbi:MAG: hypothetical protein JF609_00045 [Verrucomicrobia bacterium]|nr:hypothetical protein [Verrucomicrobiota bacterium]